MKAVYALSLIAAAASAMTFKDDPFWKSYKATFGKTYEHDAEEERRYQVFNENMRLAAEYNADAEDAEYGMTSVSDRFPEELFNGIVLPEATEVAAEPTAEEVSALPASFDARNKKWVPAVRNQKSCGSCWAFCTVASISIAYAKKHKCTPPVLSEQQLVDCSTGDHGCSGGWPLTAAAYAKKGLMLNSAYSYTARKGTCKYNSKKVKAKVVSYGYTAKTVSGMKTGIYNYGSLMIALNANKLQSYRSGIVSASSCSKSVNHGVTAIGWGKSGSTNYWLVRNSWGSSWGEKGYFRIVSGKNACGVETYPMYVTVA